MTDPVLDATAVAKRYGAEEKIGLNWIATNIAQVAQADFTIRDKWGRLMLIDPVFGPVTVADHAEARLAAADIKTQLRRIAGLARDVEPIFRKLGIGARNQWQPGHGPARSCAAIWKSGDISPLLSIR